MTTNTTALAAALNECMPLTIDGETYTFVSVLRTAPMAVMFETSRDHAATEEEQPWGMSASEREIIGILWAECVRRGWIVAVDPQTAGGLVQIVRERPCEYIRHPGTDALAFARAFAAAKRAEGGA